MLKNVYASAKTVLETTVATIQPITDIHQALTARAEVWASSQKIEADIRREESALTQAQDRAERIALLRAQLNTRKAQHEGQVIQELKSQTVAELQNQMAMAELQALRSVDVKALNIPLGAKIKAKDLLNAVQNGKYSNSEEPTAVDTDTGTTDPMAELEAKYGSGSLLNL